MEHPHLSTIDHRTESKLDLISRILQGHLDLLEWRYVQVLARPCFSRPFGKVAFNESWKIFVLDDNSQRERGAQKHALWEHHLLLDGRPHWLTHSKNRIADKLESINDKYIRVMERSPIRAS